jgi:hypothetical protein
MKVSTVVSVFLLSAFLLLSGCASTGEVKERQKFTGSFDKYKNVVLVTQANNNLKNDEFLRTKLASLVQKELLHLKLFQSVKINDAQGAQLKVKMQIAKLDEPGGATALLASSLANSEVEVATEMIELSPKPRELVTVDVTGNSKMKGRASVGGFGVTGADSYTNTALEKAAEKLAMYVKEHSSLKSK